MILFFTQRRQGAKKITSATLRLCVGFFHFSRREVQRIFRCASASLRAIKKSAFLIQNQNLVSYYFGKVLFLSFFILVTAVGKFAFEGDLFSF